MRLWRSRVEGALRFLEDLKGVPSDRYDTWTSGMARHYRKALGLLLSQPPEGQQTAVKAYLTRYKKV